MTEYVIDYKKNGHGIRVEKVSGKLKVMKDGKVLADSRNAMILEEDGLPPVYYIPISDVKEGILELTNRKSTCQYKGLASYYSIRTDGGKEENKAWRYADPTAEFDQIRDYVAFYPDAVDGFEVY